MLIQKECLFEGGGGGGVLIRRFTVQCILIWNSVFLQFHFKIFFFYICDSHAELYAKKWQMVGEKNKNKNSDLIT